ncbi:hypothetical protein ACLOJK_032503 [Asimina triloba]
MGDVIHCRRSWEGTPARQTQIEKSGLAGRAAQYDIMAVSTLHSDGAVPLPASKSDPKLLWWQLVACGLSSATGDGKGSVFTVDFGPLKLAPCALMDETNVKMPMNFGCKKGNGLPKALNPTLDFIGQIPQRLHSSLKVLASTSSLHIPYVEVGALSFSFQAHFKQLAKNERKGESSMFVLSKGNSSYNALEVNLEKQLQVWKENPSWVDQAPEINVTVPRGSLCNLSVKFKVGLPPDAVYNIVIDPDNRRVFKNIKEVMSRKVLLDEGQRQVVEVEQAAIWRFLWWSGTISVHVFVDQNRQDHTVKFKQGKTGFMKRFEGCWKVESLFLDDHLCSPLKPETLADYHSCTGGKGRVGSVVSLEQLVQPALLPPPPISWYLRGITARTTEMLVDDLQAEVGRIRGSINDTHLNQTPDGQNDDIDGAVEQKQISNSTQETPSSLVAKCKCCRFSFPPLPIFIFQANILRNATEGSNGVICRTIGIWDDVKILEGSEGMDEKGPDNELLLLINQELQPHHRPKGENWKQHALHLIVGHFGADDEVTCGMRMTINECVQLM